MEVNVNGGNFEEEVLRSDVPVLVDFWAEWCGPCMMLGPVVAEVAKEKEGALKVCKVNVDESPDLAAKFGIMSIPGLLLFKGGNLPRRRSATWARTRFSRSCPDRPRIWYNRRYGRDRLRGRHF